MPSFDVSSVDTTANTLTATGVAPLVDALNMNPSLLTGDRFRLRNVGGALPAATPALVAGQDYWAIRVDVNTIKVAVSQVDAMAGTAVDITGAGSGTTKIEYQLPYCPPTALAAKGAQVHAVDFNTTWASLVALWNLLAGQPQSIWTRGRRTLPIPLSPQFAGTTPSGLAVALSSSQWLGVQLPSGITITALTVKVQDASGTTLQANLMAGDPNAGFSIVFAGPTSAGSGAVQTITGTNTSTPVQIATSGTYYIKTSVLTGVGSGTLLYAALECDPL
jgi:hypothetical protein